MVIINSTPEKQSETKAVFVFRKSAAQFENPVCFFLLGKTAFCRSI